MWPGKLLLFITLLLNVAACRERSDVPIGAQRLDPEQGRRLISSYGCAGCHEVPGVVGDGVIGPPLDAWARRSHIAGRSPNRPDLLVGWIMDPKSLDPNTAMPKLGVTTAEAWNMAAYLYSLR